MFQVWSPTYFYWLLCCVGFSQSRICVTFWKQGICTMSAQKSLRDEERAGRSTWKQSVLPWKICPWWGVIDFLDFPSRQINNIQIKSRQISKRTQKKLSQWQNLVMVQLNSHGRGSDRVHRHSPHGRGSHQVAEGPTDFFGEVVFPSIFVFAPLVGGWQIKIALRLPFSP